MRTSRPGSVTTVTHVKRVETTMVLTRRVYQFKTGSDLRID